VIATTRVTILRGTSTDLFGDTVDTDTEAGTEAQTDIPASLIEQTRTSRGPASGTPRVVRSAIARLPAGTDVTADDRIRDERTGRTYSVDQVNQPSAIGIAAELRVDCTLIN
jgi:hypothetical protein